LESARTPENWKADPDNLEAGITEPAAPIVESEPVYKKIETPMLNNYGEMTKEEMFICFYNREKPRCADADDESLARMLKEIRLMGEILRIREHCILQEDNERETKRSRKQREARRLLDSEYKPKTNIQKSAESEAEVFEKKKASKRDKAIQIYMKGMGISKEKAEAIYDKGEID